MTIKTLTKKEYVDWDAYVKKHPEGTVFHLSQWKSVVEKTFGHKSHYLMSTATDGSITGILPLFRIKSLLFGTYLISIPFAEIGGILTDKDTNEAKLVDESIKMAKEINCDYLELRNRIPITGLQTKDLYYNFTREILTDPEENLMAIPRKARRMIRQGIKFGLVPEMSTQDLNTFYEIMARSYHNLGTPIFKKQFFRNLLSEFDGKADILLIRNKENIPVSGVLSFFFKDKVIPYYAGSLFEYRKLAPNDFMYWQLMKYGCENGYKYFDFGRSKINTGSFNFKRHWGFEPKPLSYQYHLVRSKELPNLSPANPKYKKKIEAWRKMPLPMTKIIGPPIAKYLA